jgi:hypothetical protein
MLQNGVKTRVMATKCSDLEKHGDTDERYSKNGARYIDSSVLRNAAKTRTPHFCHATDA